MFILKANGQTDADLLRHYLMQFGMPCAVFTEDEYDKGIADDSVCIVPDDPNTAVLMADSAPDMHVILFSDRTLPFGEIICIEPDADAVGKIMAAYDTLVPDDPSRQYETGHVYFECGRAHFCGCELYLTPTEELIVRHLAMNRGKFLSAENLAAYCLEIGDNSVPVHVHNINEKVKRVAYRPLIACKRYHGYCVE